MKRNFLIALFIVFVFCAAAPQSSSAKLSSSDAKNVIAESFISKINFSAEGPRKKKFKSPRKRTVRVKGYHRKNGKYVHPYKKRSK